MGPRLFHQPTNTTSDVGGGGGRNVNTTAAERYYIFMRASVVYKHRAQSDNVAAGRRAVSFETCAALPDFLHRLFHPTIVKLYLGGVSARSAVLAWSLIVHNIINIRYLSLLLLLIFLINCNYLLLCYYVRKHNRNYNYS